MSKSAVCRCEHGNVVAGHLISERFPEADAIAWVRDGATHTDTIEVVEDAVIDGCFECVEER